FLLADAKIVAAVLDEHVPFLKRVRVEQQFDALACRQLALGMLRVDAAFATAGAGGRPLLVKAVQNVVHAGELALIWRQRPVLAPLLSLPRTFVGVTRLPHRAKIGLKSQRGESAMAESELHKKGAAKRRQLMGDAAVEAAAKGIYSDPVMQKFIDVAT